VGDPSTVLPVVGVTGTNGKTTVTTLLQQLLTGEQPCGLLGGVTIDTGRERRAGRLTTPMADEVAGWLADSVAAGCRHAVLEVSSHALSQGRVDGLRFAVAVFTNLSGDHLDYHDSMESYAACKQTLFERLDSDGCCVINADDPAAEQMVAGSKATVIRCSLQGCGDVAGTLTSIGERGVAMAVRTGQAQVDVQVPLLGRHNAMNALQSLAVAEVLGVDLAVAAERLGRAKGPAGRLERVGSSPRVLVDFAHTDGALAAVLQSLREIETRGKSGRIILVVGCGGDRDRTKRSRMGKVASTMADLVWLTSDNPRTEDPGRILDDMIGGVPLEYRSRVQVKPDRREAIAEAIREAGPDDVVLIAGKGHERVQLIGEDAIPFDDRAVALAVLAKVTPR
jgi:UDP-N-acetylmuramoyl-L-alanyl-D-glutamate--2,6-diaminopimelate ligase